MKPVDLETIFPDPTLSRIVAMPPWEQGFAIVEPVDRATNWFDPVYDAAGEALGLPATWDEGHP